MLSHAVGVAAHRRLPGMRMSADTVDDARGSSTPSSTGRRSSPRPRGVRTTKLKRLAERVGLLRPCWPQALRVRRCASSKIAPGDFVEPGVFVHTRAPPEFKKGPQMTPF